MNFSSVTIVLYSTGLLIPLYTLSYDAIPYLLAMLEEWEDTNVEDTIRNSLDIMLNYSDTLDEKATVDEIGSLYLDYIKGINNEKYYYYMKRMMQMCPHYLQIHWEKTINFHCLIDLDVTQPNKIIL
ncbi:hypothetical protein PGLA_22665 [Paenibacillus glacialis]|uniref:Uncharacterized protein n=1 Tax=Paenibacillus glacialis TaxID=494026 RepID=A0A168EAB7_9BACL|nr:hypothetical protein PGLA_22665 [Paenibacillus glacialis]